MNHCSNGLHRFCSVYLHVHILQVCWMQGSENSPLMMLWCNREPQPSLLILLYLTCWYVQRQNGGGLRSTVTIHDAAMFDFSLCKRMSSSVFDVIQDHCALEDVSSVTPWVSSHQLWAGGHGSQVHHRPHLQRLHLCLWVWYLHEAFSGSDQIQTHTHTYSAPLLIIGSWVNEERNVQRNGLIEIETDGGWFIVVF